MVAVFMALYGIAAYVVFLGVLVYSVGFVGNFAVPRTVDLGPAAPIAQALAIDVLLLAAFGLQHSVMARAAFKRAWTRIVPQPLERSTYVLVSSIAWTLLMWLWHPVAQPVLWTVDERLASRLLVGISLSGWLLVVASSFLINHFEMLGLQQIAYRVMRRAPPQPRFRTPSLYRWVRHPLYLGFLLAFWATPRMTLGHFVFALGCTAYILVGIRFEERDLVAAFGFRYREYQWRVGKLLPQWGSRGEAGPTHIDPSDMEA